jgi:hypothetical protein
MYKKYGNKKIYLLRSKFLRKIVASRYILAALKIALPHYTCHVTATLHTTVVEFFHLLVGE